MRFFIRGDTQSFLSDTQESIYNDSLDFVLERLNQILARSKSPESQEALFFILGVALGGNNKALESLLDIFYTDRKTDIIKKMFMDLIALFQGNNPNSIFIKSITDVRFMDTNLQTPEQVCKDYGQALQEDVRAWAQKNQPEGDFYNSKYVALCKKYASELAQDSIPSNKDLSL